MARVVKPQNSYERCISMRLTVTKTSFFARRERTADVSIKWTTYVIADCCESVTTKSHELMEVAYRMVRSTRVQKHTQ